MQNSMIFFLSRKETEGKDVCSVGGGKTKKNIFTYMHRKYIKILKNLNLFWTNNKQIETKRQIFKCSLQPINDYRQQQQTIYRSKHTLLLSKPS